jgi:hypothetical protein
MEAALQPGQAAQCVGVQTSGAPDMVTGKARSGLRYMWATAVSVLPSSGKRSNFKTWYRSWGQVTGKNEITFAGARFSLFHAGPDGVEEIKGDKSGVGYRSVPTDQSFSNHVVECGPESAFYMTSDGLIDQVGGERGRMFGKKRFVQMLDELQGKPMSDQKDSIYRALVDCQGDHVVDSSVVDGALENAAGLFEPAPQYWHQRLCRDQATRPRASASIFRVSSGTVSNGCQFGFRQ